MTPQAAQSGADLLTQINVASGIIAQLNALLASGDTLTYINMRTSGGGVYDAAFMATAADTTNIVNGMLSIVQSTLDGLNAQLAAL